MSMLAARIAKMREHGDSDLSWADSWNFYYIPETREQGGATATSLLPAAIRLAPGTEVRVRRHAQNIGQEARTLPPKPGVILSHHRAFTPTSSVLFLRFRWMDFCYLQNGDNIRCSMVRSRRMVLRIDAHEKKHFVGVAQVHAQASPWVLVVCVDFGSLCCCRASVDDSQGFSAAGTKINPECRCSYRHVVVSLNVSENHAPEENGRT